MFLYPVNYFFTFACVFAICTYTLNFHSKYLINSEYVQQFESESVSINRDSASQVSGLFQVYQALRNAFPGLGKDGIAASQEVMVFPWNFHWVIWKPLTQWVAFSMQVFQPRKRPDQRWVLIFESPRLSDSSNLGGHVSSLRLRFYTGTYSTEDIQKDTTVATR